ncbi:succinylglutamate desuccinylase/aspartoacylase domain-containing protein [Fodinibius salsisoli]|uniref:Succinylglutamate desuccinylase/aspartoacylase family protein n=1 Tax=Fodinibius salsisoli TaxID=2820877 RepID=A0ABT3PP63_9BACT|nr:succinylglutamate desuccinylase/aspartoacylase family protein [Fodinibius salsisoli]MCW9707631.1 succinylglutamate desuccinylase/aspartoacylase family protein [Fodinibius salsisoli]
MDHLIAPEERAKTASKRIIGSLNGAQDGPLLILIAGLHGNESAGVAAVENVLAKIEQTSAPFSGKIFAIRANLSALKKNVRYIDEDMNRIWFPSIIDEIRSTPEHAIESSERLEIKQLLHILDQLKNETPYPTILADVHTFSAEGSMFTLPNVSQDEIELLSKIYAPMVLGIGESLRGTLLKYYHRKGLLSFGLEGGQHKNNLTEQNITALLMVLLQAAGCIDSDDYPEMDDYRAHLKQQTHRLPVKTELVYQHIIEEGDDFQMRPDYHNFQRIKEGEWLASDQNGKIVAQCDGYILMPLYQSQGNDGFFIIKEQ